MGRWVRRLRQCTTRRVLALFGALGVLGAAAPADAVPLPERAALEGRVADMRRHLDRDRRGMLRGSASAHARRTGGQMEQLAELEQLGQLAQWLKPLRMALFSA